MSTPSATSLIDEDYVSNHDVYGGILTAIFPAFFVIMFTIKNSSTSKKNFLPILDDILYNMTIWLIPLVVSFVYKDLWAIKAFAIANMCLHVICVVLALIYSKNLKRASDDPPYNYIFHFLGFFPVVVISIFWITYVVKTFHVLDAISIIFILLFGLTLLIAILMLMLGRIYFSEQVFHNFLVPIFISNFYSPTILQTLLIMLKWPINYYFTTLWLFILLLSLSRNVTYYVDEVPEDFLATSTAVLQYSIKKLTLWKFDSESKPWIRAYIDSENDYYTAVDIKSGKISERFFHTADCLEPYYIKCVYQKFEITIMGITKKYSVVVRHKDTESTDKEITDKMLKEFHPPLKTEFSCKNKDGKAEKFFLTLSIVSKYNKMLMFFIDGEGLNKQEIVCNVCQKDSTFNITRIDEYSIACRGPYYINVYEHKLLENTILKISVNGQISRYLLSKTFQLKEGTTVLTRLSNGIILTISIFNGYKNLKIEENDKDEQKSEDNQQIEVKSDH